MNTIANDVRLPRDMQDIQHCLKLNICRICRHDKELGRSKKHYCEACQRKIERCKKQQVSLDYAHSVPVSPYAAKIQCHQYRRGVRCRNWFQSPDRRSVTRCQNCRHELFKKEELLSCEAQRYEVDTPYGGSLYEAVRRKLGRNIVSTDFRQIEEQERKENYVGIAFKRLTPEEIAKDYPQEKIDVLLVRAKRNYVRGWVPDERSL